MKRSLLSSILAVLLAMSALALLPQFAGAGSGPPSDNVSFAGSSGERYVPGRVIVKFKKEVLPAARDAITRAAGALPGGQVALGSIEALEAAGVSVDEVIAALRASGLVEYATPDYIRHADADFNPDDPYFNPPAERQWNMRSTNDADIHMSAAWGIEQGSPDVRVAVLDSGVAYENYGTFARAPDLAGTSFVPGWDFINNDGHANDDNGHGTHVTGTIAQTTNNGMGCAGVAFGCSIMPIKILDSAGSGPDSLIAQGIIFAADNGAHVINMSLSGPDPAPILEDAINYATDKGAVVCASSGNHNASSVEYPAAYPSCVAVGATDSLKHRAYYSNYGTALDVVAPGGDTRADYNGDGYLDGIYQQTFSVPGNPQSPFAYRLYEGTSMACPHFAGVAALVKSRHMGWSAADVKSAIVSTCRDLGAGGWDPSFGFGLIDAAAAVLANRVASPRITSMSPDHGTAGTTVTGVTITGSDFTSPMKVFLDRDNETTVSATGETLTGTTKITCDIPLDGVQPGTWNVRVENSALGYDTLEGGFMVDPANDRTWYLAEGSTAYGYEEFILLQNPGDQGATAQITFMTPEGATTMHSVPVAADSRTTVRVNDVVPNSDVSAKITSDHDIICERSMYWNNRIEGTDSIGVEAPSYSWYLAEGTTAEPYQTYLLIQNPQSAPATVEVTYQTPSGPVAREPFTMLPNSRTSIHVNADLPDSDVSIKVIANRRVIAERSMYWDAQRGGHASIGTTTPCSKWYLAEGATRSPYDEWVLVQNPGVRDAAVTLTYMTPSGAVPQAPVNLPAGSRMSIHVNAALPDSDVSVMARSDEGVVVERAMYFQAGGGKGGHNTIGVPQPRLQCFLAEGSTAWGFDEWVLVQNPNSTPANVGIEYMTSSGPRTRDGLTLAPNSRVSVHVNADVPNIDTSTRVYSNVPVIAERSMYWRGGAAGHVSQGLMK